MSTLKKCYKRVTINQFIHPSGLKTCKLSKGMTALEPGSNWNSMTGHTYERWIEVYAYFDLQGDKVVFHTMRELNQPRHGVSTAALSPANIPLAVPFEMKTKNSMIR